MNPAPPSGAPGGGDFGFLTTPRSRSRRRAWTCTRSVFTVLRGLMMRHASIREAANDRRGTGCRRAPDDHRRRLATHAENGNGAANGSDGSSGSERQQPRRRQARVTHASRRARLRRGGSLLGDREWRRLRRDRKSTRLNSSHLVISYAVFFLKKKKITNEG